ncbi:hypothetical protein [Granulicella arctica]|uniref:hypothetical protein n=1 Tax=Granulicella arctica TaxID=940613 RepID=UPI0021E06910|nr:hypothetical protein [Granulicella arctica]
MDLEMTNELSITVERLAAAAGMLQLAAERLTERESTFAIEAEATLGRVVASIGTQREAELEQKLAAAEARIAELRASAPVAVTHSGRKTLPTATINLLAKQGLAGDAVASMEAGTLDAALSSLSLEQRIAVKAQLMRAGLLG